MSKTVSSLEVSDWSATITCDCESKNGTGQCSHTFRVVSKDLCLGHLKGTHEMHFRVFVVCPECDNYTRLYKSMVTAEMYQKIATEKAKKKSFCPQGGCEYCAYSPANPIALTGA